jgi:hypothetical protein
LAVNLLAIQKVRRDAEINRREREILSRLKAKYEPQSRPEPTTTLPQENLFDLFA